MKKENPVVQDLNHLERHFAGSVLIYVVLESDEPERLKDPNVVQALHEFQATLDRHQWIDWTTSYPNYLKAVYGPLKGNGQRFSGIPTTREEIAQCLLPYSLSDDEALDHLVSHDSSKATILVRLKNMGTRVARTLIREIEAPAKDILPEGLEARVAGTARIVGKTADQIARG